MSIPADQVVMSFIDKINQKDLTDLAAMLSPDHILKDLEEQAITGPSASERGWQSYLSTHPEYKIFVRQAFKSGEKVILIGHTTGSHSNLSELVEFHTEGVIWIAHVRQAKLAAWQILEDTQENYLRLELDKYEPVFHPRLYARTIAKHLDLLPPGTRTEDVRNVRKFYSRLYNKVTPQNMLLLSESLLFEQGYRFVPYELIYYHPGAIESLTAERALALGDGINDWSSADIYARFILGPAWKTGILSDKHIDQWIFSENLWQRRAAVVSTIFLGGDLNRMFYYTKLLLDDHEDLIIKALSWVLRSALQYDREAVIQFLEEHEARLAARVKREVRNKLATGLKTPKY